MTEVFIKDEFIKLGQAMKLSGTVGSGVDAKMIISNGDVKVNGDVCMMRGKKLYENDVFSYENKEYIIKCKA